MKSSPLLEVERLRTHYEVEEGELEAVSNVSFSLNKGKCLGLAGESGCGKTTIAHSIMRILPPGGKIVGGHILYNGMDLLELSEKEMNNIRWKEISIVFQAAQNALNPVIKIEEQIAEPLTLLLDYDKRDAIKRARELLELVGIDPSRGSDYPHQFSGGMKQRACIAMALACNPKILITDEPTTALDVIVQAQIIDLIKSLQGRYGLSIIYISHNLSVLSEICDHIAVIYAGRICEIARTEQLLNNPKHPYTRALLGAITTLDREREDRLQTIPGHPPPLTNPPPGCLFRPRCQNPKPICGKEIPTPVELEPDHTVYCHLYL